MFPGFDLAAAIASTQTVEPWMGHGSVNGAYLFSQIRGSMRVVNPASETAQHGRIFAHCHTDGQFFLRLSGFRGEVVPFVDGSRQRLVQQAMGSRF